MNIKETTFKNTINMFLNDEEIYSEDSLEYAVENGRLVKNCQDLIDWLKEIGAIKTEETYNKLVAESKCLPGRQVIDGPTFTSDECGIYAETTPGDMPKGNFEYHVPIVVFAAYLMKVGNFTMDGINEYYSCDEDDDDERKEDMQKIKQMDNSTEWYTELMQETAKWNKEVYDNIIKMMA